MGDVCRAHRLPTTGACDCAPKLPMAGAATERYVERIAQMWEAAGDFARAIWIRSQAQEIAVVFDRGEAWPEVWGA